MQENYFKVSYSVADCEELKSKLIKRYPLPEPVTCRLFRCGVSDIYLVIANQVLYYLRIMKTGVYNLTDYEEEANIMLELNANGVNTAIPAQCIDGKYLWSINAPEGIRYAILFTEAKNNPSGNNIKINFNLGQAVAKIHAIADEKNFKVSRVPIDFTQLIQKPLDLIKPYLNPDKYKFICDALENLRKFIEEKLTTEKPYYGFCHGDIQLGNVFFEGEIPKFFDFDCMGYGWRSNEVAVHIWNQSHGNPQFKEGDEYKAYIDGYNSIRQLNENEMDCINAFGAIRAIWVTGLNIKLLETERGSIFINHVVERLTENFKIWYEKVFPKAE